MKILFVEIHIILLGIVHMYAWVGVKDPKMTKKSKFCRSCINLLPLLNSLKSLTLKINYLELSITRIVIHLKTSKIILEKNSILGLASVTLYCNKNSPRGRTNTLFMLALDLEISFQLEALVLFFITFLFSAFLRFGYLPQSRLQIRCLVSFLHSTLL